MSLSAAMKIAISGINASQFALANTANNIANVNTPGYARKVVQFESQTAGTDAAGVRISGVTRTVDLFLAREQLVASAQAKRFEAMAIIHDRLQSLLGTPGDNISFTGKLDALLNSIPGLATDPESSVRRTAMVNSMDAFAAEINRVSKLLQDLRAEADRRITDALARVNNAILRIQQLNPAIAREERVGRDATALVDQRESALREIAKVIDIRTNIMTGGIMGVSTTSGVVLLDQVPRKLTYAPPATVNTQVQFPQIIVNKLDVQSKALTPTGDVIDPNIRSGSLRGLLDVRSQELPQIASGLGEFAGQVIDALNAAHNDNSAVPAPSSMVGRNVGVLATDLHASFTGKVTLATLDASNNYVNRVEIDFDANTISTNGGGAVALSGTTIAAVITDVNAALGGGALVLSNGALTFAAPAGAAGVVTLQDTAAPSARGGRGFAHFFGLNDVMSGQVPSHFDTGFTASEAHGFGSSGVMSIELKGPDGQSAKTFSLDFASIGGINFSNIVTDLNTGMNGFGTFALDSKGALSFSPSTTYKDYTLGVTSDTTSRGASSKSLSDLFGIGDRYVQDAAFQVKVRSDILADPKKLALAKLDINANALAGTVPALTVGDNRGVIDFQGVATRTYSFAAAGGLSATTTTLAAFGATVLSDMASKAEQSSLREKDSAALAAELEARISANSGVNLDEELANMILFQNAYAASARMIAAARDLFDILLQLTG